MNKKDERASIKMPHETKRKVAMIAAALGLHMWQVVDELATDKLLRLDIKLKEK